MGKLDELLSLGSEDYKTLTIRVTSDVANELKAKAKKLGIPRTKLVQTLFETGMEELKTRFVPEDAATADADSPNP